jgi:hypothetical protein
MKPELLTLSGADASVDGSRRVRLLVCFASSAVPSGKWAHSGIGSIGNPEAASIRPLKSNSDMSAVES